MDILLCQADIWIKPVAISAQCSFLNSARAGRVGSFPNMVSYVLHEFLGMVLSVWLVLLGMSRTSRYMSNIFLFFMWKRIITYFWRLNILVKAGNVVKLAWITTFPKLLTAFSKKIYSVQRDLTILEIYMFCLHFNLHDLRNFLMSPTDSKWTHKNKFLTKAILVSILYVGFVGTKLVS